MNKRTDEQRDAEWLRAFGGEERVEWMHWQPSIVDGAVPCVSAHVETGGVARRADSCWTVPLTWDQHQELHQHGQETFEQKYNVDLLAAAIETEARWQRHLLTTVRPAW